MSLKDRIRAAARAVGIDRLGFAAASDLGREAGLDDWLARSHHGTMAWMSRDPSRRRDPRRLLRGARTVVSAAVNYFHPERHPGAAGSGRISRYAWGGDYHRVVLGQLKRLAEHLQRDHPSLGARLYVDTGPVLEKAWAHRAGVGWIGKHSNVLTRDRGSWLFLGELLIDAEVEPDAPAVDFCGTCTRCIDACPTAAIVAPTVVDSRRCISYLTIEHRGPIARALRAPIGDWIFGCDICQDVCPWNKFARPANDPAFAPRAGNLAPRLAELARLGPEDFAARFRGSNVRRARFAGFLRNVMVALGNSVAAGSSDATGNSLAAGNSDTAGALAALKDGLHHPEPLVRAHAAWGLSRGEGRRARGELERRAAAESDPMVREEIESLLDG